MSFLKWHGCCDLWDGNRASDGPGSKKTSRQCMENRRGPDRGRDLQYGSYGSRGNISLKEVNTKQLKLPLELLRKAGANVREEEFSLHISMKDRPKAFLCAQDLIRSSLRIFNPLYGFSCMCQRREQDPGAGV